MPIAFLLGLLTSVHPILFPIMLSTIVIFVIRREYLSIKWIVVSLLLFLIPMSPLIRFEMLRNFLEVKQLLSLNHTNRAEIKDLTIFIDYVKLIFYFPYNYLHLPDIAILRNALSFTTFGFVGYAAIKKIGFWKDKFHITILLSTIIIFLAYYYFLPIHASDYYFLGVNLILLLYIIATFAFFTKSTSTRILLLAFGVIIFYFNATMYINHLRFQLFTLGNKDAVVQTIVAKEKNQEYGVGYEVEPGWQYGFGELFRFYDKAYNIKPTKVAKKNIYTISSKKQKNKGTLLISSGTLNVYVRVEN